MRDNAAFPFSAKRIFPAPRVVVLFFILDGASPLATPILAGVTTVRAWFDDWRMYANHYA